MAAEGLYLKIPISTSHTVFTKKIAKEPGGVEAPHTSVSKVVPYFQARKSYKVSVVQFIFRDGETKIQKNLLESHGILWINLSSCSLCDSFDTDGTALWPCDAQAFQLLTGLSS